MALFGTETEKNIKKFAAETEAAWKGIGQAPGLRIWRIEKFQVVAWPEKDYGKFYDGDSYIVLSTKKVEDKLLHDVHFWLGEYTTQDEAGTAAYKTVELDDFLNGLPVEYRECMGHESDLFLSYFKNGLKILKGGIDSGFRKVATGERRPARLLHIKGTAKNISAKQVECISANLNSGDVFLVDDTDAVYLFVGAKAGVFEKTKGAQMARAIDDERGGKVAVHTIGEFEMDKGDDHINKFWELLGGRVSSIAADSGVADNAVTTKQAMFSISDSGGSIKTTPVPFAYASLKSDDVFLIDIGSEVFVWVGTGSSPAERTNAFGIGQKYLTSSGSPAWTRITKIMQGGENEVLMSHFNKKATN
jgi:hypothetical protein